MLTDDYLEKITQHSDAVQVIVRDYDGSVRVFNLDNAKVVLRYKTEGSDRRSEAYHPGNLKGPAGFRPEEDAWLELAIITDDLITLESE